LHTNAKISFSGVKNFVFYPAVGKISIIGDLVTEALSVTKPVKFEATNVQFILRSQRKSDGLGAICSPTCTRRSLGCIILCAPLPSIRDLQNLLTISFFFELNSSSLIWPLSFCFSKVSTACAHTTFAGEKKIHKIFETHDHTEDSRVEGTLPDTCIGG
jgi:hypothetical protein